MNARRGTLALAAVVFAALTLAAPASAQQDPTGMGGDPTGMGGAGMGGLGGLGGADALGAPADPSGATPASGGFGQQGATLQSSPSLPVGAPDQLFGLKPSDAPRVVTLAEALAAAATNSFDLRIAREKVVQQEAQVRRAWSMLLPQVALAGTYNFNCTTTPGAELFPTDGTRAFLDCNDVTVSLFDDRALDGQIAQAEGLGTILDFVADVQVEPEEQQRIRQQATDLYRTANDLETRRDQLTQPTVVQPAHVFGAGLTFTMPLFNGRAFPLLQNAYTAVDAIDAAGMQGRQALLLAVTRAYFSAFTAKKLLAIASEQRDAATRHRDATKVKVELNTAPPLSLRRAELDLIRAEQSVRQAEAGFRGAVGAVGALSGIDELFDVAEPPRMPALEDGDSPEALVERALAERLDLRAQKMAVTIADRQKVDAWMMFVPSLSLVAQSRASSNASGFVDVPITSSLMLQASIPLYDGGARYAALKETSSRVREELLKVRQLEQRIAGQVRGNLDDLRVRLRALELSREAVGVAKESVSQANTLLEVGAATPLDVSDTNLALFVAEIELARAELDVEQARLGLAYVVGALPPVDAAAAAFSDEDERAARDRLEKLPE
jgi:outer membrane protein